MKIRVKEIEASSFGQTLGYLAGVTKEEEIVEYKGETLEGSLMVIASIVSTRARILETLAVFMIAIVTSLGSIMEIAWKFEGTLNAVCAIGVVFYYFYLHVSIYSRDQLTNTFKRRIFYFDIEKLKKDNAILIGSRYE